LPGRPPSRGQAATANRTATVGLELLQAIARMNGPATLTEIAQALTMSVTTTSRYLASLSQAEFLHQDDSTGKYDLGPAAIELGAAAMSRIDAVRLASDLMRGLTATTNLVSILAVWGTSGPTLIKCEQGTIDVPIRVREALHLSVLRTAAGRIFLAYHDREKLQPLLARELKQWNAAAPPDQRLDARRVEEMRAEIVHDGIAHAAGLNNPVLAALAVPVFGPDRRLLLSLAVAGVIGSFDASPHGDAAATLKETAARLTRMLGGSAG
jgi:DNA-binding IclR family transcriptional regulator